MSLRGGSPWSSHVRGGRHSGDEGAVEELGEVEEEDEVGRSPGQERKSYQGELEGSAVVELAEERRAAW